MGCITERDLGWRRILGAMQISRKTQNIRVCRLDSMHPWPPHEVGTRASWELRQAARQLKRIRLSGARESKRRWVSATSSGSCSLSENCGGFVDCNCAPAGAGSRRPRRLGERPLLRAPRSGIRRGRENSSQPGGKRRAAEGDGSGGGREVVSAESGLQVEAVNEAGLRPEFES
jgi:hypothetical protein